MAEKAEKGKDLGGVVLRVDLVASPLGGRTIGYWWLSAPDLLGAQVDAALRVRRGLQVHIRPIASDRAIEDQALEMAATFSFFIKQIEDDLAGQPFVVFGYATPEDPTGGDRR